MANGKTRTKSHILGEDAVRFLQNNIIPSEWVVRTMNPDYGIDLDVELFDYEEGRCITFGEHLFLQVKGTQNPNYGYYSDRGKRIAVIKYSLEVDELNLVSRMGSAFLVLLIVVDLNDKKAFQICLNDYIKNVLSPSYPSYKDQNTVTIYIPIKNILSAENYEALKWYGMRVKLYSMFHEMLADIEDFKTTDIIEKINLGKNFINHYLYYDVFNKSEHWFLLEEIHSMLIQMYNNNCTLDLAIKLVQQTLGYTDNWDNGTVYEGFSDVPINAFQYAQKMSIDMLSEAIVNSSGMFETYCRE